MGGTGKHTLSKVLCEHHLQAPSSNRLRRVAAVVQFNPGFRPTCVEDVQPKLKEALKALGCDVCSSSQDSCDQVIVTANGAHSRCKPFPKHSRILTQEASQRQSCFVAQLAACCSHLRTAVSKAGDCASGAGGAAGD
jgi:hypothetical protein